MSARVRLWVFALAALASFLVLLWGVRNLPPFGDYRGPYGDVLNRIVVYERHATDVVTAVNFDVRGLDTLGEESILFLSVIGATLLLRRQRREEEKEEEEEGAADRSVFRNAPQPSDATRAATLGLVGALVVFGLYIVAHGQLTPGGGFQGGVVLATAPLLVYIAGDLKTFKHITSRFWLEAAEAAGIFGYAAVGFLGMILDNRFLENVLPLGVTGNINSAGTITVLSIVTGIAVTGGFVKVNYAFLEQTLEITLRSRE